MVEITRTVDVAKPARIASGMAHQEARRLHHRYLGPEHVLLGLLLHGDNPAARVLRAHGLDLATVRAEVDRLITQGVLPGPQPSDSELLATLGIDLDAVSRRVNETFGDDAYWRAAQRVRLRSSQPVVHLRSSDPLPPVCARGLGIAAQEAIARDQEVGPEHLLLGLLDDAEDLVETETNPTERRTHTLVACQATVPMRSSCSSKRGDRLSRRYVRRSVASSTANSDARWAGTAHSSPARARRAGYHGVWNGEPGPWQAAALG